MVSPPEIKYYPCAIHELEKYLESLAELVASLSNMRVDNYQGIGADSQEHL